MFRCFFWFLVLGRRGNVASKMLDAAFYLRLAFYTTYIGSKTVYANWDSATSAGMKRQLLWGPPHGFLLILNLILRTGILKNYLLNFNYYKYILSLAKYFRAERSHSHIFSQQHQNHHDTPEMRSPPSPPPPETR